MSEDCKYDTDGDGDCHICSRTKSGCIMKIHPLRGFWRNHSGWYEFTNSPTPEDGMSEGRLCIDTWNHAIEECLRHVTNREDIEDIRRKIKQLRYEI